MKPEVRRGIVRLALGAALLLVGMFVGVYTSNYYRFGRHERPLELPARAPGGDPWEFDTAEHPRIRVRVVTRGLSHPWALAFLPDGGILVTERPGQLRIVRDGALDPKPVSGVPVTVADRHEPRLLDVAVHPDFAANRFVYLTYMKQHPEGGVSPTLARGVLSTEGALHDVRDLLVTEPHDRPRGRNARIAFAADGTVFLSTGWTDDSPQDPMSLRGKILRLRDDGSVPRDNPFVEREGHRPEIYSLGHRNTLGLALHPETGQLWNVEPGPLGGDEINIILPGRNYGWPDVSFGRSYDGPRISAHPTREGVESPVVVWLPGITPAGMAFYTGDRFPQWNGNLFVGSLRTGGIGGTGRLERIVFNERMEEMRRESLLTDLRTRIREVRQGPDGFLYVLTDQPGPLSSRFRLPGAVGAALLRIEPAD